jgi:hypothetical protein
MRHKQVWWSAMSGKKTEVPISVLEPAGVRGVGSQRASNTVVISGNLALSEPKLNAIVDG